MATDRLEPTSPSWLRSRIDVGRRRTLIGLSGVVAAALGGERAWAQAPQRCVLTPEAGEGPFYLDPKLIRADISSGRPGAPLQLAMQIMRAGDCATCRRGTKFPDGGGNGRFRTIFPSWYGGRTPHVHFKVFLGGKEVVASQIFFPAQVPREVFNEWQPYRDHVSKRPTFNDNDPIKQGVYSTVTRER